jgi:hypothetical protein
MRPLPMAGFARPETVVRRLGVLALAVVLGLLMVPGTNGFLGAAGGSAPPAPGSVHAIAAGAAGARTAPSHSALPSHPAASLNISPLFFQNDWSVGNASSANTTCNTPYGYCYTMSQNPSLLSLANGDLGIGFSAITNFTSAPSCSTSTDVSSRIAWSTSSDGGQTFAPLQYIGNSGASGCPYFEGIEPSFAVATTGTIFGAFVATNASSAEIFSSSAPGVYGTGRPVLDYVYRPYDALALVSSSDNGSTWSATQLLVTGGNISMPRIATFGQSVYIVYTDISNSTSPPPGAPTDATDLQFVYSTDAGSTWHGPVAIPAHRSGASSAQDNSAMDPSIAVNPSGTVAVAFAGDRDCFALCAYYNAVYADDILLSTSSTNGSTWSAPKLVATGATEFGYGSPNYGGPGLWEGAIDTSIQWGSASDLYVAWSQSEDMDLADQYYQELDYANSGIFSAASTNGGTSWSTASVTGPLPGLDYNQEVFGFGYFNPALAVHNGTVYLAYSFYNWTNGGTGRNAYLQNAYGDGNGEWLTTSSNGVAWGSAALIVMDPDGSGITDFDYWGYLGSIAFDAQGEPVVAYALQTAFLSYNPASGGFQVPVALVVASVYQGATTTVAVEEEGLSPGTLWQAQVGGDTVSTTASEFNITDAPVGRAFYIIWPGAPAPLGYRAALMPQISEAPIFLATGPSTDFFNFSVFYGVQFSMDPGDSPGLTLESANFNTNGAYQFYWYWAEQVSPYGRYYYSYGAAFPWYFPAGTWLNYSSGFTGSNYYYGSSFVGYWSGTGDGAFNGSAAVLPLHVEGPINETAWMGALGVYSESVAAPTLPSSSTFSFSVNGGSYTGTGGSNVVVSNLTTGGYELTNISATSSQAGWQYFGYPSTGNPVVIPNVPFVNLSFADEDLASGPGQVSYHAVGLPNGATWDLAFNGTSYSSSTPWINVTARTGDYAVQGFPTIAPGGNISYVPSGIGSNGNVVVGQVYDVNFTSTYQVQLEAANGGTLSMAPGSYYLASGGTLQVSATPNVGFRFGGWTGTGAGSFTGPNATANVTALSPVIESASFLPLVLDRFNVTVNESGVPNGTEWSIVLGGVGYSSTAPGLVVPNEYSCTYSGALGRYTLAIPYTHTNGSGVQYVPTSAPQTVCGGGTPALVQFEPQYSVSVVAAFGGSVQATPSGGGSTSSPYWLPVGDSVGLLAIPLSGYTFVAWVGTGSGSYSGPLADASTSAVEGPVTEIAEFAPVVAAPPTVFTATFLEQPSLAPGTTWTISNATSSLSSTSTTIVLTGLSPGPYTFTVGSSISPDGQSRYTPASPGTVTVNLHANQTVPVTFTAAYRLTVATVGPGTAAPASEWVSTGSRVSLSATSTGTAVFLGWSGTGPGSYSGSSPYWNITITAPVGEVASFAAAPPAVTVTTGPGTSVWSNPLVWAGLGIVGLVLGLAAGAAIARGRRPPSPPEEPADAAEPPSVDAPPAEYVEGPAPPETPAEEVSG